METVQPDCLVASVIATVCETDTATVDDPGRMAMQIMKVQMEMDGQGIDCYRVMSDHIIKSLPSSTREEGAQKLQELLELLMTKLRANEAHSITVGAIRAHSIATGAYIPCKIARLRSLVVAGRAS